MNRHYEFPEEDLEDVLLYFTLTDRETGYFWISGMRGVQFELLASFQKEKGNRITLNIKQLQEAKSNQGGWGCHFFFFGWWGVFGTIQRLNIAFDL